MTTDPRARVVPFSELEFSPTAFLFEGERHAGNNTSIFIVRTPPGGGVDLHTHPYPETFVLLEGTGQWTAGDDVIDLHPDHILAVPANTPHGFRNTGDRSLLVVSVHEAGVLDQTFLGDEPTG